MAIVIDVRRVGLRLSDRTWMAVAAYGRAAGILGTDGQLSISDVVRDLIARGLSGDRSREAGYRAGYAAGRSAGFAVVMKRMNEGSE